MLLIKQLEFNTVWFPCDTLRYHPFSTVCNPSAPHCTVIDNNKSSHKRKSCMAERDSCFIIFESLFFLCFSLFFVCGIYNVLSLVSTRLKRVDNALSEYSLGYGLLGTMEGCACVCNNTCLVLYCFSYQTRSVQSEPL